MTDTTGRAKLVFVLALVLATIPSVSFGDESPPPPSSSSGGGVPLLLTMPWGLTAGDTPRILPGTSVTDEHGVVLTCSWWYPQTGCFDITHTDYYRTMMKELARQLLASGVTNFGVYAGWVDAIK